MRMRMKNVYDDESDENTWQKYKRRERILSMGLEVATYLHRKVMN